MKDVLSEQKKSDNFRTNVAYAYTQDVQDLIPRRMKQKIRPRKQAHANAEPGTVSGERGHQISILMKSFSASLFDDLRTQPPRLDECHAGDILGSTYMLRSDLWPCHEVGVVENGSCQGFVHVFQHGQGIKVMGQLVSLPRCSKCTWLRGQPFGKWYRFDTRCSIPLSWCLGDFDHFPVFDDAV